MEQDKISRSRLVIGWILSSLIIAFMLFDGIIKILKLDVAVDATRSLGYADHHIVLIGLFGILPTILYAIPRTSILGAILLTAHLGAAVNTHFRLDHPLLSHILFPVYIAVIMWAGIWLRNRKLRQLLPVSK